jgi:serralysin
LAVLEISPFGGFDMARGLFPAGELIDVLDTRSSFHSIAYDDEFGRYAEEDFFGYGFAYNWAGELIGGVITGQDRYVDGLQVFALSNASISVATQLWYVDGGDLVGELAYVFRGDDDLVGNRYDDRLIGMGGHDAIWGGGGGDDLYGEEGDDFVRGEDGDDLIEGGSGHDDLHGNAGFDLVYGGLGDDWVVGGKDDDRLYGDWGDDIVLGNLGHDDVSGGDGHDVVRGGQGDDIVLGGAGDDWLSGDRGSDTLTGGAGADVFHLFGEAGDDRVTDFHASEGDQVYVVGRYTVAQTGADVVVSVEGGARMVLFDTQLAGLPADWIFS